LAPNGQIISERTFPSPITSNFTQIFLNPYHYYIRSTETAPNRTFGYDCNSVILNLTHYRITLTNCANMTVHNYLCGFTLVVFNPAPNTRIGLLTIEQLKFAFFDPPKYNTGFSLTTAVYYFAITKFACRNGGLYIRSDVSVSISAV